MKAGESWPLNVVVRRSDGRLLAQGCASDERVVCEVVERLSRVMPHDSEWTVEVTTV